jgi:hypothetical protein
MRRAVRLWLVVPVPADVRDISESHDHPAAVFACRRRRDRLHLRMILCIIPTAELICVPAVCTRSKLDRTAGAGDAISNAIGYAKHRSPSHDGVIRVYDGMGNMVETHEHAGDFKDW